ncbi:MAG: gliding motility-associated C-terminal domain-containing protein [Crocinitomicaceae bacterium]|nr:gliding motility-associated C-terminal domain-containing protein [Crocinitomicaceae bacterium]
MLRYYVKNKLSGVWRLLVVCSILFYKGNVAAQCPTLSAVVNTSICAGQSTGGIDVSLTGGSSPFSYSWTNGATTQDLSNVIDGTYTCTVTDGNNCVVSITETIQSNQILTLEEIITNPTCFGFNNGAINIVPGNGTQPYTYNWSNGSTIEDLSSITAGNYSVQVTDNNGCSISGAYTLTQPTLLSVTETHTNVLCFGQFNGTITTNVSGGTLPYSFLWNNNNNNQNLINLDAGNYNLTVTDNKGCQVNMPVQITQPPILTATTTQINVTCYGQSTGSLDLTMSGGTSPYQYSWDNGLTTQDLIGIPAGNYTVNITDANNCPATATKTILQNSQIVVGNVTTNITCNGLLNGAVNITALGGVQPYVFGWSNGATTEDLTGLGTGFYQLTLTDNLGCNSSNAYYFNVSEPSPISLSQTNIDIPCANGTGSIDLTVTGGVPSYQYVWSSGQTTQDIGNLSAGDYSVTVSDANGCSANLGPINIANGPTALALTGTITNAGCFGQSSGAIDLNVTGGVSPYSYFWSVNATSQDISGINAGSYTVTVTDANTCSANQTFVVTEPSASVSVSETHTDVICAGTATGTVNLTVNGGTAPYSFLWSNGLTTEDASAIAAGSYTVQITDANSCNTSLNVALAELYAALTLSTTQQNVACFSGATGQINLSVLGGSPPYAYAWSNNASTQDIGGLTSGTYSVSVTDFNNCAANISATISQPLSAISASETNVDLICVGYSTGSINVSVSGGTAPYTYSWSNAATIEDLANLPIGSYTLIVSDNNDCMDTITAVIDNPANGLNITSVVNNVSCFGGANGGIDLTISGGTPGYVTTWSNGLQLQDLSNLSAGTYTVSVTDNSGCVLGQSFPITQPDAPLTFTSLSTNVLCYGDTTGAVTLALTGGTPIYSFVWSNGATTEDIYNLPAGTYSVTMSDANGCSAVFSSSLTQPSSAISMTLYPTSALCFGTPTGSVDLSVSGGVPGYTYSWSNGTTTQDLTTITGGQYSVTIQDANGCLLADTVNVGQPLSALTLIQSTSSVSCTGLSNGFINLTVSGGTGPYSYAWNNGVTTQDLSNVPAGTYSVVVTDANGCTGSLTIQVTQPSALVGVTGISANVICHGGTTGSIAAQGTGGTGVYTYLWSTGSTSSTLTGIPAGIYSVIVSDNYGCNATQSWTITQPSPITMQSVNTNILCYGQSSGGIVAQASGGVAPYSYSWTNGLTGSVIVNQVAGPYFVTVLDDNGCSSTFSDTIYQPQSAITMSSVVTNNTCFGVNGGSINNTVSGGTLPYQYQWNTGSSTEDLTNLLAGVYTLSILDANGCIFTSTQTVSQPPVSMTATETHVDVSCYGGSNGVINLTVSGTGFPFSYLWSNGQTTQDIDSLTPGVYSVTVTDDDGCLLTQSVNIGQPSTAMNVQALVTDVLCYGNPTGSIDVTVTGGVAPYTYNWSNGPGTQDISNMIAGVYTLTVYDFNGCLSSNPLTISQPSAPLTVSLVPTNIPCFGQTSGAVDLIVNGGTLGYSYLWNNGTSSQDIFGLSPGGYNVVVTDGNGCTASGSTLISQPSVPMTVTSVIGQVLCYGGSTGSINITATGGTSPYNYLWNGTLTNEDLTNIPAGSYVVAVNDANGCYVQQTYVVQQSSSPLTLTSVQTPSGCYGGSNGQLNLTVTGGTIPYTYAWNTGSTSQDLQNLAAGIYTVTVTDGNGCSSTLQDTVTQPSFYGITAQVTPVACFGQNTGAIDATVIGGTAPFTYSWSNTQTTQDLSGILAGSYIVSVTDQQGCLTSQTFSVSQPSSILSTSTTLTNVSCTGSGTGGIDLTVTGGNSPYNYTWSNQATTQDLSNVAQGTYTVVVTDAGGCQVTTSTVVTQPQAMSLIVNTSNPLCPSTATGSIDLTVNGGTQPYGYAWSGPNTNATTQDIGFITAGIYFVTVTDANGCIATQSVSLQNPIGVSATYVSTPVQCYGGSNGSVNVTVSGGATPYTYQWNTGAQTQDIWNVPAGNDTLVITDALGCIDTLITLTTQPNQPITITSVVQNVGCFGTLSASINITVEGGTPGYTYLWLSGQTTQDLYGLGAGSYGINVTDFNGCTQAQSFTITAPLTPMMLSTTGVGLTCFNSSTGSVDLTITGGVGPYQINWSTGSTNEDIFNLPAATYEVFVEDVNGCLDSATVTLQNPSPLLVSGVISNVQCYGQSTGGIDVTVVGGAGPYFYSWSNGATSEDLANLSFGTYTVTVTDFNGCVITSSYYVSQPSSEAVISSTVNNILCFGNSTGWINATAVGGALPYTYFWQGPSGFVSPTEDIFGVIAGSYVLMVTDGIGCVTQDTIVVSQPALITPTVVQTNVSCYGFGNGSLDISVTGGVGTYDYSWNIGSSNQDLINLPPGTYSLTITDDNNCTVSSSYTITQPVQPLTLSISQVNVSCTGASTGFINLNTVGGTFPYTYSWSTGATTEDIFNLPVGNYSVLVTDANGCTSTSQTTITEPNQGLSISSTQTNVSCYGGTNGIINIQSQGGTPSYDYLWNNGQTTSTISGLPIGTYTVLVTDSLNCSQTMNVTITQPQSEITTTNSIVNLICLNDPTGWIDLTMNGGTPAYNYSWSNGETTQDIDSLASGDYTVTITDILGCVLITTLTVEDPINPMLVNPVVNNVSCFGGSDAEISLVISGGLPSYDILWSTGDTIVDIDSLVAGNYSVLVTDAQGCETPLSFTITEPAPIVAYFNPSTTFGCSPLSVTFTNNSSGPYTNSLWNFGNATSATTQNGITTFTQPGCYDISLIVSNAAGCADTMSTDSLVCVVSGPDASFSASTPGIDYYTGQLVLLNTSDGDITDYLWTFGDGSPNSTLENPIHYYPDQQAANYEVTLTIVDTNGCVDTASYEFSLVELLNVYVPNTLTINGDNINDVFLPVFSNVDIMKSYQMEIYNRWGQLVWETDIVSEGWNGRYKDNKDVQLGVYTWKIRYTDNKGETRVLVGHVTTLR